MQALQPLINSRKYKGDGSAVNKWIKLTECSNFHCQFLFFFFSNQGFINSTSSLQLFQQDNQQFLQDPSVQGSGKPQERGWGFCLKIGEGRDERQSDEGGCKHCNEVTNVKLTPESILMPTSREGRP